MNNLLYTKNPLVVNPELAELIGLNEAIILQQIHYWLDKTDFEANGKKWIYNTIEQWCEQFSFFSKRTIERTFKSLKDKGLIEIEKLSQDKRNRTNYFTINYEKLETLMTQKSEKCNESECGNAFRQNDGMENAKMAECIIGKQRLHTKTTNRNKKNKQKKEFESFLEILKNAFTNLKIKTFESKINKTKKTKESFELILKAKSIALEILADEYAQYVARNKKYAARLDKWLVALLENKINEIEYVSKNEIRDKLNIDNIDYTEEEF